MTNAEIAQRLPFYEGWVYLIGLNAGLSGKKNFKNKAIKRFSDLKNNRPKASCKHYFGMAQDPTPELGLACLDNGRGEAGLALRLRLRLVGLAKALAETGTALGLQGSGRAWGLAGLGLTSVRDHPIQKASKKLSLGSLSVTSFYHASHLIQRTIFILASDRLQEAS